MQAPNEAHGDSERRNVGSAERLLSALLGGYITSRALSRGSLGTALLLLAGGTLMARGITGHCAMYRALGTKTAEDVRESRATTRDRRRRRQFDEAAEGTVPHHPPATVEEMSEESFPASDPPSYTPTSSVGRPTPQ